jgi:hypothetical protein
MLYLSIIKDPLILPFKLKVAILKKDIIVSYCDFLMEWNYKKFKREIINYDFGIVSFKGFHPSSFSGTLYCYLKVLNNEIINLREKKSFTKNHRQNLLRLDHIILKIFQYSEILY